MLKVSVKHINSLYNAFTSLSTREQNHLTPHLSQLTVPGPLKLWLLLAHDATEDKIVPSKITPSDEFVHPALGSAVETKLFKL